MINSNRPDIQVADASEGGYEINIGDKKAFDKGYEKFCKKHGLRVGWQQSRGGFSYGKKEKES